VKTISINLIWINPPGNRTGYKYFRLGRMDMHQRKIRVSFVVIFALVVGPVLAQQPQGDEHHAGPTPPAATAAAGAAMPGGSMPGAGGMPAMAAIAGHVGVSALLGHRYPGSWT
jgi:hypothetical protein